MNEIPIKWLADPVTKEHPEISGNIAICSSGKYVRNEAFGYWDFIPPEYGELMGGHDDTWHQLQNNGVVSYENDPEHNLGVGERNDYRQFGEFCMYHGAVLDIGCGPQTSLAHYEPFRSDEVDFVGIDPLEGQQPREFAFIKGLGEYLPFIDNIFDQVLFVTSLDHFIDPVNPLKEAKRVLKQDGEILIWIGEKSPGAPKPNTSPEWYASLVKPVGADDVFHYKRFTSEDLENMLVGLGLKIEEKKELQVDEWRKNLFYRIRK